MLCRCQLQAIYVAFSVGGEPLLYLQSLPDQPLLEQTQVQTPQSTTQVNVQVTLMLRFLRFAEMAGHHQGGQVSGTALSPQHHRIQGLLPEGQHCLGESDAAMSEPHSPTVFALSVLHRCLCRERFPSGLRFSISCKTHWITFALLLIVIFLLPDMPPCTMSIKHP